MFEHKRTARQKHAIQVATAPLSPATLRRIWWTLAILAAGFLVILAFMISRATH